MKSVFSVVIRVCEFLDCLMFFCGTCSRNKWNLRLVWLFYRLNKKVSALVSEEKIVESSGSGTDDDFKLTYLEVGF